MAAILTLSTAHGIQSQSQHENWIRNIAAGLRANGYPNEPETIQPIDEDVPQSRYIIARINHSRWVADCKNGDGGVLVVEPDHPMMCPYCCNVDIGGAWRRVVWPDAAVSERIESILSMRMLPMNRNWDIFRMVTGLKPEEIWKLSIPQLRELMASTIPELVEENREHPDLVRLQLAA